jgi:hypothetical protein
MDVLPYQIDYERSLRVARPGWVRGKECYQVAARTYLRSGEFAAARYVEGWVVCQLPFEHGWLELDGLAIDPLLAGRSLQEDIWYFPGVRYTRAQVLERGAASLPFVDLQGRFGLAVVEYVAARDAAYAWFAEQVGMVLRAPQPSRGAE